MKMGIKLREISAVSLLALAPFAAAQDNGAAAKGGCIELKSIAQIEESYTDANGQPAVRLVAATKVVPGTQVIWALTATNVCKQPADKVYIDNPVPEHMRYLPQSAVGTGAEVSYSLDGKRFGAPETLTVAADDGKGVRAARPDEYTHIRFSFRNPIGPGQLAGASFRAAVR